MTDRRTIFTIGHSTHTQQAFLRLLAAHRVTAVCDVRSRPYSRMSPQFNREDLKAELQALGIAYVFLGSELGARTEDRTCYRKGKVQFDLLAQTRNFQSGLDRVAQGSSTHRIALMCAEKEPIECHRTILVARHLAARDLEVQHIHAEGHLESQHSVVKRLMQKLRLRTEDLFHSQTELIDDAYALQAERIAFDSAQDVGPDWAISEAV